MRRLALGVTTESHPLYGTFMSRLSTCIFEWDEGDFQTHLKAKGGEMVEAGVSNPTDVTVRQAITTDEMAKHCHRCT